MHDVDDAFGFVCAIVSRSNLELGFPDREDLREYLLGELWILSTRFDGSRGSRFSIWAKATLSKRVYDWLRAHSLGLA
ncbi:MAG TPA: hypothetical protein VHQ98_11035 [Gaiellaceae bacterium]|nr:hypothetical protein [Gaiellaceae bacterium]